MTKKFILLLALFLLIAVPAQAKLSAAKFSGKLLLIVDKGGELWYVKPGDLISSYLGKPEDFLASMRQVALGISEKDLASFKGKAPQRLAGRFLLRTEDNGKIAYVNPSSLKIYLFDNKDDALSALRELALGIKNNDFEQIKNITVLNSQNNTTQVGVQKFFDLKKDGYEVERLVISNDTKNIALVVKKDKKYYLILNNKTSEAYDRFSFMTFSPDSKRLAYCVRIGEKDFVIIDGKKSEAYDRCDTGLIVFSPDSKQIAYSVIKDGSGYVVLNGEKSEPYKIDELNFYIKGLGRLVFSPDSKKFAYDISTAFSTGPGPLKNYIIINGEKMQVDGDVQRLVGFTPDSKQLVYGLEKNNRTYIVVGSKKIEGKGSFVSDLTFSPDFTQFAYTASEYSSYVSLNGGNDDLAAQLAKLGVYGTSFSLVFSPDSKQFACILEGRGSMVLFLNGEVSDPYDVIYTPIFSNDSKYFAYSARRAVMQDDGSYVEESYLFLNGKQVGYNIVSSAVFTPDSKQLVYAFQNPNDKAIYINRINLD